MEYLDLHILAGEAAFLFPHRIDGAELAAHLSDTFRYAPARWLEDAELSPRFTHDALAKQTEDRRIKVFARALATDFARGPRPLMVIPRLTDGLSPPPTDTNRRGWGAVLSDLDAALHTLGHKPIFHLHLITAPGLAGAEARVQRLHDDMVSLDLSVRSDEDSLIDLDPTGAIGAKLIGNFLSHRIADKIVQEGPARGLHLADREQLEASLAERLNHWNRNGLHPTLPLDDALITHMADAALADILTPSERGGKK